MGHHAVDGAFPFLHQHHILGTDDHIYRLVLAEAGVHAGKSCAQDLYQIIPDHGGTDDIAVADKVCHKCVLGFVVDLFRTADLLDITLVHHHDGVGHGQGLLLVVGDIDEGNAQFIFQPDQLVLHVLAQL